MSIRNRPLSRLKGKHNILLSLVASLLLVVVTLSPTSHAFGISTISLPPSSNPGTTTSCIANQHLKKITRKRRATASLLAVVYGEDGKRENPREGVETIPSLLSQEQQEEVVERAGGIPALIRIACANAPPPHDHLIPSTTLSGHIERLTLDHMDIAVAVGTADGTSVLILVPVTLPPVAQLLEESTNSEKSADAVVDALTQTLQKLDRSSYTVLEERERDQEASRRRKENDGYMDYQRLTALLQEEPNAVDCPDWWTLPSALNARLLTEASTMKRLLNEDDFASDLKRLVSRRRRHSGERSQLVEQVRVASVGPSGLFLRASIMIPTTDEEGKQQNQRELIDVPIPFVGSRVADSADDLQVCVLELVESEEVEEDAPPVVAVELPATTEEEETVETKKEGKLAVEIPIEGDSVAATNITEPSSTTVQEKEDPHIRPGTVATVSAETIAKARQQPKSAEEEAKLAAKYAAIDDLGNRAYAILKDLYMV